MSEQKPSFMQELDRWTDENVIQPLWKAQREASNNGLSEEVRQEKVIETVEGVKNLIRQKVLQSYRNGRMTRTPVPGNLPVAKRRLQA